MVNLKSKYFDWLFSIADVPNHRKLCMQLFITDFWWLNPFDANRADDGVQLRYRFGRMMMLPDAETNSELDNRPCSIFELMVSLAIRCEEDIMGDERFGNRTSQWIQTMIHSLGLYEYDDSNYDEFIIGEILTKFLNRQYSREGRGSLFYIPHLDRSRDMRSPDTSIWHQMNWYLNMVMGGDNNGYY